MAVDSNWQRVCKLTIDHTKVNGDVSNFPILLNKSNLPNEIFTQAKSDGSDIRFATTSAGSTEIPAEIVTFSASSSACEIWVAPSSISSSVDTDLFVFYKNSTASMPAATATNGKNAVWDSNYKLVEHLSNTLGDSTSNGLTASNNGTTINTGTVKVGTSVRNFDASTTYIDYGNVLNINGDVDLTFEALWYEPFPIKTSNYSDVVSKGDHSWVLQHSAPGGNFFCYMGVTIYDTTWRGQGGPQIFNDTWVHSVGRRKASDNSLNYWSNGSNNTGATTTTIASTSYAFRIGNNAETTGHEYGGYIDEVRVSDNARSDAWIITTYNTMNSPSTFVIEGTPFNNGATPATSYINYDHGILRGTFRGVGRGIM